MAFAHRSLWPTRASRCTATRRGSRPATRPRGPDEVLISPSLAERISAGIGSQVHPADGPPLTVTGIAEAPYCISCEQVVALPGSRAARLVEGKTPINLSTDRAEYLVDLPPGASAEALWRDLADQGVGLTPRDAYQHPDGSIRVELSSEGRELTTVDLPARFVRREEPYTSLPSALIPPDVAREHGWDVEPARVLIPFGAETTPDQVDSARVAAERVRRRGLSPDPPLG